jgi:hypothetical protein
MSARPFFVSTSTVQGQTLGMGNKMAGSVGRIEAENLGQSAIRKFI